MQSVGKFSIGLAEERVLGWYNEAEENIDLVRSADIINALKFMKLSNKEI